MKNSALYVIPIVVVTLAILLGKRLVSSGMSPTTMMIIAAAALLLMILVRPKSKAAKSTPDAALSLLGDFAKDAFADDEKLEARYQSAVADYVNSMPKSAISKLEKLLPQCKTDADSYAVNVALGLAKSSSGDFDTAIKLYNKAVILHPTTELAAAIGTCQQRIGELEQARDSFEFALDLDPNNIEARSALATAYVADGMFDEAIDEARLALEQNENHASSLATCAICYGVLDDNLLYKSYKEKAVANGYKEDKITSTVPALKKRFKR